MQADYERAQKMWDAQLITSEQLDHAKYKAEADSSTCSEFAIAHQRQAVGAFPGTGTGQDPDPRTLFGVVARRYVRQGQQVAKGDRLFWVTAEGPLRMRFTLPEKFIGRVQKGEELPIDDPGPARTRNTRSECWK